jgi:hypothetical protein
LSRQNPLYVRGAQHRHPGVVFLVSVHSRVSSIANSHLRGMAGIRTNQHPLWPKEITLTKRK